VASCGWYNNEFQVRRGRLKLTYEEKMSKVVLQLDITNRSVGVKDAYLQFKEPWLKAASLTMGLFDRPFGHEISFSSSTRESPERSRLFQTLFPGERDVGAMLEIAPPEKYSVINVQLKRGMFNGNGIAADNNSNKDFIGRIGANLH
jgi:phosphate-selective porin